MVRAFPVQQRKEGSIYTRSISCRIIYANSNQDLGHWLRLNLGRSTSFFYFSCSKPSGVLWLGLLSRDVLLSFFRDFPRNWLSRFHWKSPGNPGKGFFLRNSKLFPYLKQFSLHYLNFIHYCFKCTANHLLGDFFSTHNKYFKLSSIFSELLSKIFPGNPGNSQAMTI
jgi:hypothetical protein